MEPPDRIQAVLKSEVLSELEPGDRILDLCCGTGGLAEKLTEAE
ncbi:ubiquinone/menaquinone biosynthesis C-methylase UbiE [Kroppenstedtia sanguinis]|uniref:SAM-dependent MTase RsmB/NOP-type domain-containing protein n=1 Tax=Kroppenstedtia sanguinis TaxID=1380684 RepID=A0ABW4C3T6_9BACL